jgi:hypothetical protein
VVGTLRVSRRLQVRVEVDGQTLAVVVHRDRAAVLRTGGRSMPFCLLTFLPGRFRLRSRPSGLNYAPKTFVLLLIF